MRGFNIKDGTLDAHMQVGIYIFVYVLIYIYMHMFCEPSNLYFSATIFKHYIKISAIFFYFVISCPHDNIHDLQYL